MPLKIGFFAESCIPIHALSLEERPLGGTETGLIRVSKILKERGNDVIVFTKHASPKNISSKDYPIYLPSKLIHQTTGLDCLVLVKDFKPASYNLPAKRIFYWTGDGPEQFINYGVGDQRISNKLEKMFCVSNWHVEALCEASSFPISKCINIGNGVHLPFFQGEEVRDMKRLMWASSPNRGLDLAFLIFSKLYEKDPTLSFHIFAGFDLYDTETKFSGPLVEQFNRLKIQIQSHPGCILYGNITQENLAREYMKSAVLFYPNKVFETCCIVAMEAHAAGCPVVASNLSALPETVQDGGVVINGVPGSEQYINEAQIILSRLLTDTTLWNAWSRSARYKAKNNYAWEKVADKMEEVFN